MRLKRLIAVSAIAGLLAVGALGFAPKQTLAQGPTPAAPTCDSQANDTNEAASTGADADNVDLQCGDQTTPDANVAVEASAAGPDTDNVQQGSGQQVEDGQPDLAGAVEAPDVY